MTGEGAAADGVAIRRLRAPDEAAVAALAGLLIACVEDGASVGFMAPLTPARAEAFWRRVAADTAAGARALLVAEAAGRVVGTAQLALALPENQPHRADVAKVLTHPAARRRGIGAALMRAVEAEARAEGRTLLVLDTVSGSDADRLYARLGWTRAGEIPDYALWPDGRPCATTVFWRRLG
jgi:GNAT superfamily N-acetyltransferase